MNCSCRVRLRQPRNVPQPQAQRRIPVKAARSSSNISQARCHMPPAHHLLRRPMEPRNSPLPFFRRGPFDRTAALFHARDERLAVGDIDERLATRPPGDRRKFPPPHRAVRFATRERPFEHLTLLQLLDLFELVRPAGPARDRAATPSARQGLPPLAAAARPPITRPIQGQPWRNSTKMPLRGLRTAPKPPARALPQALIRQG